MIAIPVLRRRVAPVLNWCSRILIFPATNGLGPGQEVWIPELGPLERLRLLREKGVTTLICGALSAELQRCSKQLGLRIISGVAGEVDEVLKAYWQDRLDQPEFWLPGCLGPRRYRHGCWQEDGGLITEDKGGKLVMPGKGGRGRGEGQGGGPGGGPGRPGTGRGAGMADFCQCPACGARVPHERGIPCMQVNCPQCGKPMVRE